MNGAIIYDGLSLLDGARIVAIATGLRSASVNSKTGDMIQTWIIRPDLDPVSASRTGADASICGACPHRGKATERDNGTAAERSCYVSLIHGPSAVYRTFKRNGYPTVSGHDAIAKLGASRMVRIGSYGDGAAVPSYVWDSLISRAKGHTAYSHQAMAKGSAFEPRLYMRSVESEREARVAWAQGQRTFRVVAGVGDVVKGAEILCPASEEMGKRTTCGACGLCGGASIRAKSIAIVVHGTGRTNFVKRVQQL